MTTLVVGARGAVGRHVVDGLLAAGEEVRASVRDRSQASFAAGVDVVEADLARPATLAAAFDGVDRAFVYAVPGLRALAEHAAGCGRVVLLSSGSVLLPWATDNAIAVEHRAAESVLAGLPLVPVRPLVLANNAGWWAPAIRARHAVDLVHPESVTAPVHERDIAAVAVAALLGTARSDPSALLTGPDLLTQREQTRLIGDALGRRVEVREIDESEARARFGDDADAVLAFLRRAVVEPGPVTTTAHDVLGRDPHDFATWVADHLAEFR